MFSSSLTLQCYSSGLHVTFSCAAARTSPLLMVACIRFGCGEACRALCFRPEAGEELTTMWWMPER